MHIVLSEVDWQVDDVYSSQSVDWQRFSRLSRLSQSMVGLRKVSRSYARRLTPGTNPKWSPYGQCNLHYRWVQRRNSCRFGHLTSKKYVWPWFLTPQGYPRSNLTVPIESPWLLSKSPPRCPTSYLSPFSRYFEWKDFDVDLWPIRVIQGQIW